MPTWINGDNGNRASVELWGSAEAAKASLAKLIECSGCSDCSDCSGCSRCSDCSECSDCSRCSECSDCSGCSACSECSRCSDCSRCSRCSRCSDCSRCSECSDCSRCSDCSGMAPQTSPMVIPVIEDIHRKIYEAASAPCALEMGEVHRCETTHCRAGWTVHLAGEAGYALEKQTSWLFAAQQIYKASGYDISPVRFYDSNADALTDMKKLAETNA